MPSWQITKAFNATNNSQNPGITMTNKTTQTSRQSRKLPFVKTLITLAAASVLSMSQAQASIIDIDFEDSAFSDVSLFINGDTVVYKNVLFKTETFDANDTGLSGALIDGNDPFASFNLGVPGNNFSKYYGALNNGWFSIQHKVSSASLRLKGLDFSFIAPLPTLLGFVPGQLVVAGEKGDGSLSFASRDFAGQDNKGNWTFDTWNTVSEELGGGTFAKISVLACLYTNSGDCVFVDNNQAQFGVDNLKVDVVSAPATAGLFALSLAGLFAANRRRQQAK
jgi:hypothetical protein